MLPALTASSRRCQRAAWGNCARSSAPALVEDIARQGRAIGGGRYLSWWAAGGVARGVGELGGEVSRVENERAAPGAKSLRGRGGAEQERAGSS